jgi:DNA-directed RNA polymerase subunit M/transcription elongation factor TFIIS
LKGELKIFNKQNTEHSYVHDEIVDRISGLYIDCPECENIIHSDEQYQCGTCGGGVRINVLNWVKEQAERAIKKPVQIQATKKFNDVINSLGNDEVLSIELYPVNQVMFTLKKGRKKTTAVMPNNHHCDAERIVDLIDFMRKRFDSQK